MTRTDRNLTSLLLLAFIVGAVVATATGAFATRPGLTPAADVPAAPAAAAASDTGLPGSEDARRTPVVLAVERVAPSVVSITTRTSVDSMFGPQTESTAGSGVVIDATGIVLTNAHVVNQAQEIKASFADGKTYDGTILGLDADLDLAVLRLEGATGLKAVPIGSSAGLMLGEPVIAIGNPYGLGHTVTTGVVSSVHRAVETKSHITQDFIQTDASINPGNSGGPLLDVRGRLIGINTAIYQDGQNIGFAIPSDRAVKIAHDLLQFGLVQAPWLGCDLDDAVLKRAPGDAEGQRTAAVVTRVFPGTGAASAGLRVGDVLIAADQRPIQGPGDLTAYLAAFPPGRAVELSILRNGEARNLTVQAQALDPKVVDAAIAQIWGATLTEVPDGAVRPGRARGVAVASMTPDGAFAAARLRVGDRIIGINGTALNSLDDLHNALSRAKSAHRGKALLAIQRGGISGYLYFPI